MMKLNRLIILFTFAASFLFVACGDNDLIIDDPNQLNPDIPILDIDDDDSFQEHLRSFDEGSTKLSLADGVKLLTPYQLRNVEEYDYDTNILYFNGEAEIERLPQPGDMIIYSPYTIGLVEALPSGIIGRVASIDESQTKATPGRIAIPIDTDNNINDFFEDMEFEKAPVIVTRKIDKDKVVGTTPYDVTVLNFSEEIKKGLLKDMPVNCGMEFEGEGKIKVKGHVSANKRLSYFDFVMVPSIEMEGKLGLYAELDLGYDQWYKQLPNLHLVPGIWVGTIFLPLTLDLSSQFYVFLNSKCSITGEVEFDFPLANIRYGWDGLRPLTPFDKAPEAANTKMEWSLNGFDFDGSVGLGVRMYLAVNLAGEQIIASYYEDPVTKNYKGSYFDVNLGLYAESHVDMSPGESTSSFHNDPVHFALKGGVYVEKLFNFFEKQDIEDKTALYPFDLNIKDLYLYPTYKYWRHNDNVSAGETTISAQAVGDLLLPVTPGFSIYEGTPSSPVEFLTGAFKSTLLSQKTYHSWWEQWLTPNTDERYSITFNNLEEGKTYTVVPFLGYFNDILQIPSFADNRFVFTFGEETEEEVRRVTSITFPNVPGIADAGSIRFRYDSDGRLERYIDPYLDINATFDWDNKSVYFQSDGEYNWTNYKTNSKGYITRATMEEGLVEIEYDANGFVSWIRCPDSFDTFDWDNGKLVRMVHKQEEYHYTYVMEATFSYDKNIPAQHGQLWFFGNTYGFLMRGKLLGEAPRYLPTGATITETDGDGTTKNSVGMSYTFDSEGYILTERLSFFGIDFPFTYHYDED